jgi:hypothetical protein
MKEKTEEETYWVPVTRTETLKARLKVSATSPGEAAKRARQICQSLTPATVMTALGKVAETELEFGRPWKRETIPADATPEMTKEERSAS